MEAFVWGTGGQSSIWNRQEVRHWFRVVGQTKKTVGRMRAWVSGANWKDCTAMGYWGGVGQTEKIR